MICWLWFIFALSTHLITSLKTLDPTTQIIIDLSITIVVQIRKLSLKKLRKGKLVKIGIKADILMNLTILFIFIYLRNTN